MDRDIDNWPNIWYHTSLRERLWPPPWQRSFISWFRCRTYQWHPKSVQRDKCSPLWTHKAASLHFPSSKKHWSDHGAENSENSHLGCYVLSDSAKEIFNVRARQMIKLVHKISVCVSVCLSLSIRPSKYLSIHLSITLLCIAWASIFSLIRIMKALLD